MFYTKLFLNSFRSSSKGRDVIRGRRKDYPSKLRDPTSDVTWRTSLNLTSDSRNTDDVISRPSLNLTLSSRNTDDVTEMVLCRCDRACTFFGDCCLDAAEKFGENKFATNPKSPAPECINSYEGKVRLPGFTVV